MKFHLVYTKRAVRDIKSLEPIIKDRIGRALKKYEKDPLQDSEKLTDQRLGNYRFRIGDYRVIFDNEGTDLVVLRVGHRRDIYRKL